MGPKGSSDCSPKPGPVPPTEEPVPQNNCPMMNTGVDYETYIADFEFVTSWEDCSRKCTGECQYWNWFQSDNWCITIKEAKGFLGDEFTEDQVSGERSCVPSVPSCAYNNTNTQYRKEITTPVKSESWKACSKECKKTEGCHFWTWHHEKAGRFKFNCVLMADYGVLAHDTNAITGDVNC